jgi:hypothetical protein
MYPWVLVMSALGGLAVELHSNIISEIESGMIVWDDTPWDYFYAAGVGTAAAVGANVWVHGASGGTRGRAWALMLVAGTAGVCLALGRMFVRSRRTINGGDTAASAPESLRVFVNCLLGTLVLTVVAAALYVAHAVVFAHFRHVAQGWMGCVMMAVFPLLRVALTHLVEAAPYIAWGFDAGKLCAAWQVHIVAAAWHGAFMGLLAGCAVGADVELAVLGCAEAATVVHGLWRVHALPPTAPARPGGSVMSTASVRIRGPVHDAREVHLATSVGVSLLSGVVFPAAFLFCSFTLIAGPNRYLFGLISDETDGTTGPRLWSLDAYSGEYASAQQGDVKVLSSRRLLLVSGGHAALLLLVTAWLRWAGSPHKAPVPSNTAHGPREEAPRSAVSRDLWGLIGIVLEYHSNIIVLSAVLTLAVAFSVVLPSNGVNTKFY